MEQSSLFDGSGDHERRIEFAPGFDGWLVAARAALRDGVTPDQAWWQSRGLPADAPGVKRSSLENDFAAIAEFAACVRRDDRWALLYRVYWRLHHGEPHLLEIAGDQDILRLTNDAKSVRRDRHKMKAFVRFREVQGDDGDPHYVAWFEPDHLIVRLTAPFFKRRFTAMRWSILTPDECAHWDGRGKLSFSPGADKRMAPDGDRFEEAWRVYYRSIFNPARLKVNAMRAEMPQKYWKNMPEAHDIATLIRDADRRVAVMEETVRNDDTPRCGPRPASPSALLAKARANAASESFDALRLDALGCERCELACHATQTVFGEGPDDARIMLVGEQPGDEEDLTGRPFVGPAGAVLDAALEHAGVDRGSLYVTNAVKHFGFDRRGRRRLHKTPTIESVHACMHWLRREMALVDPDVVICLGRTAAMAVLGRQVSVLSERGKFVQVGPRRVFVSVHPSWLLRLRDAQRKRREQRRFANELALACAG